MGSQATMAAMRSIAARRDGYRCCYCRVPTAATVEHSEARSKGGSSWADNLKLACPYCNRKKGARPLADFLAAEGWQLEAPSSLPDSTREMLLVCFGVQHPAGLTASGSPNAKLELTGGQVSALVRAHKGEQWRRMLLGTEDNPAVAAAAWDFLTRHDTPARPRRRPPRRVFATR